MGNLHDGSLTGVAALISIHILIIVLELIVLLSGEEQKTSIVPNFLLRF